MNFIKKLVQKRLDALYAKEESLMQKMAEWLEPDSQAFKLDWRQKALYRYEMENTLYYKWLDAGLLMVQARVEFWEGMKRGLEK